MRDVFASIKALVEEFKMIAFLVNWGKVIVIPIEHIKPPMNAKVVQRNKISTENRTLNGDFIFYSTTESIEILDDSSMLVLTAEDCQEFPVLRHKVAFNDMFCDKGRVDVVRYIDEIYLEKESANIKDIDVDVKDFRVSKIYIVNWCIKGLWKCHEIGINCQRDAIIKYHGSTNRSKEDWWGTVIATIKAPYVEKGVFEVIEQEVFLEKEQKPIKIRISKNGYEIAKCSEYKTHTNETFVWPDLTQDDWCYVKNHYERNVIVDKKEFFDFVPSSREEVEELLDMDVMQLGVTPEQLLAWEFNTPEEVDAFNKAVSVLVRRKLIEIENEIIERAKYAIKRCLSNRILHVTISKEEVKNYLEFLNNQQ